MDEYLKIQTALATHSDQVVGLVASLLAHLGSKPEWSIDDNLDVADDVARLASRVGLPRAGDQTENGLSFYRAAATHLGFELAHEI
jgi:hypothetical protein